MISTNELPTKLKTVNSVLMVSNNFWIGGRETFIADTVSLMRDLGTTQVNLIANSIKNSSAIDIFDEIIPIGERASSDQWLLTADMLLQDSLPDLIWVHHYNIAPALLLANKYSIPLHVTLHGPLLSAGIYNHNDALAFVIATSAGATVSCVSNEIMSQLSDFQNQISFYGILPNKIKIRKLKTTHQPNKKQIRFAIFSRQDKLNHLKQSLLLMAHFKRNGHAIELDIYTGITETVGVSSSEQNNFQKLTKLFGRKWMLKHALILIGIIRHVRIHSMIKDVPFVMQKYDVILGMGRVSLEALAYRKTSILIGYEKAIGLISTDNFEQYQTTNFSGRNQVSESYIKIVKHTVNALNNNNTKLEELSACADIESSRPMLKSLLEYAVKGCHISIQPESVQSALMEIVDNGCLAFKSINADLLNSDQLDLLNLLNHRQKKAQQ